MNTCKWRGRSVQPACGLLTAALLLAAWSATAAAADIEGNLTAVPEAYARAYASPFIHAHGPNQNANLFSTARIPWAGLTFGIGVKAMGTQINETDQNFRRVLEDVDLGLIDPSLAGQTGTVIMEGPTMFGDTGREGSISLYVGGVEVYRRSTIAGILDSRFVPLATPEAYVGGVLGLKAVIRWFPEIEIQDYGKTKHFGWGLQWSASGLLREDFPVDLMVGYFKQGLDVTGVIETDAESLHLVASHAWPALTVYGGYAWENTEMKVDYTFVDPEGLVPDQEVSFKEDGVQDHRWTLGVTLDILLDLNLEMGHGKLTTYSAGLMFGL